MFFCKTHVLTFQLSREGAYCSKIFPLVGNFCIVAPLYRVFAMHAKSALMSPANVPVAEVLRVSNEMRCQSCAHNSPYSGHVLVLCLPPARALWFSEVKQYIQLSKGKGEGKEKARKFQCLINFSFSIYSFSRKLSMWRNPMEFRPGSAWPKLLSRKAEWKRLIWLSNPVPCYCG